MTTTTQCARCCISSRCWHIVGLAIAETDLRRAFLSSSSSSSRYAPRRSRSRGRITALLYDDSSTVTATTRTFTSGRRGHDRRRTTMLCRVGSATNGRGLTDGRASAGRDGLAAAAGAAGRRSGIPERRSAADSLRWHRCRHHCCRRHRRRRFRGCEPYINGRPDK